MRNKFLLFLFLFFFFNFFCFVLLRPTRWDEWILFSSPRLAPFRTRTANSTINTSCPAPTNTVAHAPLTGPDDVRMLIPEMNKLIQLLQPMLSAATILCDEVFESFKIIVMSLY